jgi:hypothetical protein
MVVAISEEQTRYFLSYKAHAGYIPNFGSEDMEWVEAMRGPYLQLSSVGSARWERFATVFQITEGIKSLLGILLRFQGGNRCKERWEHR